MVERIDHLSQLAEALAVRLSYFAILPASTSFLSSPSLSLALSPDFLFTLDRLDVALAFVRAHPHYRDAALYKMRFEHCVVRAGTLIRMYAVGRWKDLAYEVSNKLKEWDKARHSKGKEKERSGDDDRVLMVSLANEEAEARMELNQIVRFLQSLSSTRFSGTDTKKSFRSFDLCSLNSRSVQRQTERPLRRI